MLHAVPRTDGDRGRRGHRPLQRGPHPRADRAGDDPIEAGNAAFHLIVSLGVYDDREEVRDPNIHDYWDEFFI